MYRIMIIEDDLSMADAIKKQIESWGNDVMCIRDFREVISAFVEYDPHLVLVDIMLPFYNGYYWCSEIRKISNVPVVFLSSASDNMNIVMAMNMGGDEFIEKPFDLNVVTAKVQALLRRSYSFGTSSNLIEYHGAVLNLNDAVLTFQNQKANLTKNEFQILKILLENAGKIVSRDRIIEHLWDSDAFIDDNTLTVNVTRLRKKLDELGMKDVIRTKKGIGYMVEL